MNKLYYNGEEIQPVVTKLDFPDGQIKEITLPGMHTQEITLKLTLNANKARARYMHYKRYMRWLEYCEDCKAHGINPHSNKGNTSMAYRTVASFVAGLLGLSEYKFDPKNLS